MSAYAWALLTASIWGALPPKSIILLVAGIVLLRR